MRRFVYSILFALLCVFTNVLSQPALAAPREMNAHTTFTTYGSFQEVGAYRSFRYDIALVELHAYPARRYRPKPAPTPTKHPTGADTFFYDASPIAGETGAE